MGTSPNDVHAWRSTSGVNATVYINVAPMEYPTNGTLFNVTQAMIDVVVCGLGSGTFAELYKPLETWRNSAKVPEPWIRMDSKLLVNVPFRFMFSQ